ncbi:MAG: hypothetical protein M0P14_04340 [Alkaliphilus sp.]|nr:hypothetical protein [Alkaliphilus sp.]
MVRRNKSEKDQRPCPILETGGARRETGTLNTGQKTDDLWETAEGEWFVSGSWGQVSWSVSDPNKLFTAHEKDQRPCPHGPPMGQGTCPRDPL